MPKNANDNVVPLPSDNVQCKTCNQPIVKGQAHPHPQPRPSWVPMMGGSMMILFGFAEGAAMHLCGLTNPQAMRQQMTFTTMTVMKVFLGGVGTSAIIQSVFAVNNHATFDKSRHYADTSAGVPRVAVGCAILGVGMTLAGSGPTITPSQMGAGVTNAGYVIAGMLGGGSVFSLAEEFLGFRTNLCIPVNKPVCLDKIYKVHYASIAYPFGVALLVTSFYLEHLFPVDIDASKLGYASSKMVMPLLPAICGVVVGLNQLPLRLVAGKGQGGSTAIMQIVSTMSGGRLSQRFLVDEVNKSFQLLTVYIGTTLGAAVVAHYYPQLTPPTSAGVLPIHGLLGGAAMIFGARLANGCTCGNGISGVSELSWHSMIGAACIFGAAIGTALTMNSFSLW